MTEPERTDGTGLETSTYLSVADLLALAHHQTDDAKVQTRIETALPDDAELPDTDADTQLLLSTDDLLCRAQTQAEDSERIEAIRRARSLWQARDELDRSDEPMTDGGKPIDEIERILGELTADHPDVRPAYAALYEHSDITRSDLTDEQWLAPVEVSEYLALRFHDPERGMDAYATGEDGRYVVGFGGIPLAGTHAEETAERFLNDDDLLQELVLADEDTIRGGSDVMTDGGQATLDARGRTAKPPAAHLTGKRPTAASGDHDAGGAREWWCTECNRRVTEASDAAGEFGHAKSCEHHFTREWEK